METEKCKACQEEIDLRATKCPKCGVDQRGWFRRHFILTVVLVLILIGVVGGTAGGSKNSSLPQVEGVATKTNANATSTPASDIMPKVGEVTKLGDREFLVNNVKRSQGFNYNTPKSGKEFVIVNVTIKNLGTDEVSYNPFDFKVQDANGAQESETFATLDDSLNSGTLAPGGKVSGSIPFEVPIGDGAKLIFQPSFWNNQRVVVDLGSK